MTARDEICDHEWRTRAAGSPQMRMRHQVTVCQKCGAHREELTGRITPGSPSWREEEAAWDDAT